MKAFYLSFLSLVMVGCANIEKQDQIHDNQPNLFPGVRQMIESTGRENDSKRDLIKDLDTGNKFTYANGDYVLPDHHGWEIIKGSQYGVPFSISRTPDQQKEAAGQDNLTNINRILETRLKEVRLLNETVEKSGKYFADILGADFKIDDQFKNQKITLILFQCKEMKDSCVTDLTLKMAIRKFSEKIEGKVFYDPANNSFNIVKKG